MLKQVGLFLSWMTSLAFEEELEWLIRKVFPS